MMKRVPHSILSLTAVLILAVCAVPRLDRIGRSLEYDEIWTLEYYASAPVSTIFSELAVPNNHALHSLLMKAALGLGASDPVGLRIPALLCGLAALWLMFLLAGELLNRRSALLAELLLGINVWAAAYSQTARGYSLQLALLLGCGWLLLRGGRAETCAARRSWYGAAAVAAVLSVLTLPTSALYLVPLFGVLLLHRRRDFDLWGCAAAVGIFIAVWFGIHYADFRQGQDFGVVLDSVGAFLRFAGARLTELLPPGVLIFALAAFLSSRRRRLVSALWLIALFPLAAALATRGGEARVYQPSIPPLLLLAVIGVENVTGLLSPGRHRRRLSAAIAALLLAAAFFGFLLQRRQLEIPDWYTVCQSARKLPPEILVVYPGNDCVTAEWNNRQEGIAADFAARLASAAPERFLLQLGRSAALNGLSESGAERELAVSRSGVPFSLGKAQGTLYSLEKLETLPEGDDIVVIVFPPQSPERLRLRASQLSRMLPDWLMLNQPLCQPLLDPRGDVRRVRLFAVRAGDHPGRWPECLALAGSELQFYRLR